MKAFSLLLLLFVISCSLPYDSIDSVNPQWQLIWSDEFNGTTLDTATWNYDTGYGDIAVSNVWGWGVGGLQEYTSNTDNVRLSNGYLVLESRYLGGSYSNRNYTSGKIHTRGKFSFSGGLIQARIRLPYGKGMFPAFWMLGTNDHYTNMFWPRGGEIDIMEMYGGGEDKDDTVLTTAHWYDEVLPTPPGYSTCSSASTELQDPAIFADDFHVFEAEIEPNRIVWRLDGKETFRITVTEIMKELNGPMYVIFNLGIGSYYSAIGYPDASTVFPQAMLVDWVRVYQKTN